MSSPSPKPLIRALWLLPSLIGVALLLPRLAEFFGVGVGFVQWPWQFDFTEGVDLDVVNVLSHGTNIYGHLGPGSFVSAPYTPLFFVVNAVITRFTGASFGPGRAMSLAAAVLIAVLIAYLVWLVGKRVGDKVQSADGVAQTETAPVAQPSDGLSNVLLLACGIFAGALWLSLSPVIIWGALYTPNMPALLFEVAGIAWTLAFARDRRVYWGIVLFLLAFYTKQSALDAAAAATLWLLLVRFRTGLRFGIAFAASLLLSFGLFNFLLHGGLWEHAFGNQLLPWGWDRFLVTARKLVGEYWPLLMWNVGVLVLGPVVLLRWGRGKGRAAAWRSLIAHPLALVVIYLLIATLTTATRIGRNGTNYNHLLDMLLPACPIAGAALYMACRYLMERQSGKEASSRSLVAWVGAGLAAMCALIVVQVSLFTPETNWYKGAWPSPAIDSQMKQLSYLVSSMPGNIYSEDTYLLLSNNRPVVYDDAFMFTSLAKVGKWDDSVLNSYFKEHYFSLVLLERGSGRFTAEGEQLFKDNYKILYEDIRDSYVPNTAPSP